MTMEKIVWTIFQSGDTGAVFVAEDWPVRRFAKIGGRPVAAARSAEETGRPPDEVFGSFGSEDGGETPAICESRRAIGSSGIWVSAGCC